MPARISSLPYSIIQEAKLDSRFLKITHNVKRENLHKKYKASNLKYPYPIYFFFFLNEALKDINREKLYQDLRLEIPQNRRPLCQQIIRKKLKKSF